MRISHKSIHAPSWENLCISLDNILRFDIASRRCHTSGYQFDLALNFSVPPPKLLRVRGKAGVGIFFKCENFFSLPP